jgi:hypothetical protein
MEPIHLFRRPTGNLLRLEGPMLAFVEGPGRQLLWARLADNGKWIATLERGGQRQVLAEAV